MRPILTALIMSVGMAVSAPAWAGTPLWQNIESGMSVEQVRALYPEAKGKVKYGKKTVEIKDAVKIGDCHAIVELDISTGVVSQVVIRNSVKDSPNQCGGALQTGLVAKYGKPLLDSATEQDSNIAPTTDTVLTWRDGETVIVMKRYTSKGWYGDLGWRVSYAPASSLASSL